MCMCTSKVHLVPSSDNATTCNYGFLIDFAQEPSKDTEPLHLSPSELHGGPSAQTMVHGFNTFCTYTAHTLVSIRHALPKLHIFTTLTNHTNLPTSEAALNNEICKCKAFQGGCL